MQYNISPYSYVIPVILLSILLNIPKLFETKFVWKTVSHHVVVMPNGTSATVAATAGETRIVLGVAALRSHPGMDSRTINYDLISALITPSSDYIRFYINWTRLITTGLVPMAALVFFNWNIFRGIRMTHERTRKNNKQKASEMNLAAILLCIVFLFLICHFPREGEIRQ